MRLVGGQDGQGNLADRLDEMDRGGEGHVDVMAALGLEVGVGKVVSRRRGISAGTG